MHEDTVFRLLTCMLKFTLKNDSMLTINYFSHEWRTHLYKKLFLTGEITKSEHVINLFDEDSLRDQKLMWFDDESFFFGQIRLFT